MADADVPDSTDWLSTPLRALAAVEASLRCQVCKDFYRTPMLTSCSHTFCSLCIRRALSNDGKCPLCRAGEQELKLRSNWSMEETVDAFVKARPDVLAEARRKESSRASSPKRKANATEGMNGEDAHISKRVRTSARLSKSRAEARPSQPVEEEEEIVEVQDDNDEDENYTPENNDGLVACPVCNNKMKEWQVFKHLESCTGPPSPSTNNSHSGPSTSTPFRKPSASPPDRLPAINYSMLKETALRKKLSELGISSTGPRALLEKRHKEWVTLWNANCDAAKPKRRQQLLHDLEVWERTQSGRAVMGGRIGSSAVMVKDKDFDGRAWASTHDESFRELIENARRSRVKAGAKEADPEQPSEETSRTREIQEVPSSSPPPDAEDDAMDTGEAIQPQERIPGDDGRLAQVPNASAAIPLDDMADLKRRPRDDNDWENIDTAPIC